MKQVLMLMLLTGSLGVRCQTLTDGEYMIKIFDTGKFLAIAGGSNNNGANLIQWDKEYGRHFFFLLKHLGNNVYTVQLKHSGKFLSTQGVPAAGAKLIQWDWKDQDNQKWIIQKQKGSRGYVISSFQNRMRMVVQHFNSSVTPGNGAYAFLQGDNTMRPMVLDFKKNEVDEELPKPPGNERFKPGVSDNKSE
ncbi:MAG: RICIN domain-containing protein [Pseudobacter sp.]|uniref:RICIN domain-containing protein n=1 Tax=Pseudobacter sp. TaxID=2045420 RepID=UPI003F7DD29C